MRNPLATERADTQIRPYGNPQMRRNTDAD
jgi:hypothetical protein